ncbi:MAG: DinB family protein [Gemmatimonadota bacterium]
MSPIARPAPGEHADYYARYVAEVPDGNILETLREQLGDTLAMLQGLTPEQELYRYAEGKWSLREVVVHLVDTERLFAFRALAMARGEGVELPGMDQDEWVASSDADGRTLDDLGAEWAALRRANIHMFATFPDSAWDRVGRASGYDFTVRSFPWIIAGHELWHQKLIGEHYVEGGS